MFDPPAYAGSAGTIHQAARAGIRSQACGGHAIRSAREMWVGILEGFDEQAVDMQANGLCTRARMSWALNERIKESHP